jgi:hypothetical protein
VAAIAEVAQCHGIRGSSQRMTFGVVGAINFRDGWMLIAWARKSCGW